VVVALTGRDARLASHLRSRGGRGAVRELSLRVFTELE